MRRLSDNAGQKAFAALEVEKLYAAEAKRGRPRKDEPKTSADLREFNSRERRSDERAASATGASGRAVSQAKRVQQTAPDLAEKVRAGQLAMRRPSESAGRGADLAVRRGRHPSPQKDGGKA